MSLSILLGTTGLFQLSPPFTISQVNYTITKLNLINGLVNNGSDVYNSFYAPAGLSQDQYNSDLTSGQAIVTLESDNGPTIEVPSSFISLSPVEPPANYKHLVISIDLGDLLDTFDLNQLTTDIKSMSDSIVGFSTNVNLHALPASKIYSHADSLEYEAQRNLNIQNYKTFYTAKVDADAELAALKIIDANKDRIIINLTNRLNALSPPT